MDQSTVDFALFAAMALLALTLAVHAFRARWWALMALWTAQVPVYLLIAWMIFYVQIIGPCASTPKVVPFEQGMTLCPGQSATFAIPVPR